MSGQQELICGLSRVVTIAVLPRLNMEELIFELKRRIQNLDKENSIKEKFVSILRDVMLEEYRQLEVSSPNEMNIPVQDQETVTTQADITTPYTDTMPSIPDNPTFSKQLLDTNNSISTSCTDKTSEGGNPCEETPLDSFQPTPDHGDVHIKMECHMFEDDQIGQISEQSTLEHLEHLTDNTETAFINRGHEQVEKMTSEEMPMTPYQPIPDQDCEKMASLLPDHDSQIDSDDKRYLCDVCGFKTSHADSLSKHRQRHTGDKPLMCGECGYRAYHNCRLVEHMRTHTGEKPFKCNLCDFKAACKNGVANHMKRHMNAENTDAEPYTCGICAYQTYRRADMKRHMKGHSGVKPLKCEECDYSTAYKQSLTRHRRQHTGERPFSCRECDFKANDQSSLARHKRRKHKMKIVSVTNQK
ncbi:zinc finger protein 883-like [Branchiostoma lanceolatum]|uniref:zinc finger protein 883-like n=1 Tax=Branchiostoma lanceolatum TaxID=7740 RepID=UPI003452ED41